KPGQVLYVEVGGVPFNGGGASIEGGSGGGAPDVRTISMGAEPSPSDEASLDSRLLVAAGGGGRNQFVGGCAGGAGGDAEGKGTNGATCEFEGGEGGGAGEANKGGKGGQGWFLDIEFPGWTGRQGQLGIGGTA